MGDGGIHPSLLPPAWLPAGMPGERGRASGRPASHAWPRSGVEYWGDCALGLDFQSDVAISPKAVALVGFQPVLDATHGRALTVQGLVGSIFDGSPDSRRSASVQKNCFGIFVASNFN
jgi:hypothetical protein